MLIFIHLRSQVKYAFTSGIKIHSLTAEQSVVSIKVRRCDLARAHPTLTPPPFSRAE